MKVRAMEQNQGGEGAVDCFLRSLMLQLACFPDISYTSFNWYCMFALRRHSGLVVSTVTSEQEGAWVWFLAGAGPVYVGFLRDLRFLPPSKHVHGSISS